MNALTQSEHPEKVMLLDLGKVDAIHAVLSNRGVYKKGRLPKEAPKYWLARMCLSSD